MTIKGVSNARRGNTILEILTNVSFVGRVAWSVVMGMGVLNVMLRLRKYLMRMESVCHVQKRAFTMILASVRSVSLIASSAQMVTPASNADLASSSETTSAFPVPPEPSSKLNPPNAVPAPKIVPNALTKILVSPA